MADAFSYGCAGVAMDDLVYICTKIARQMDAQGLDRIFDAAEAAAAVAEEAKPLLQRVVELVDEVKHSLSPLPTCSTFAGMHVCANSSQIGEAAIAAAHNRASLWTRRASCLTGLFLLMQMWCQQT